MNGAMADPPPNTIRRPKSRITMIIGTSQYFFRSLIKLHMSLKKLIF